MEGHVLGDLVLWRDGIAEEAAAARPDGGLSDGLAALPDFSFHGTRLLSVFFDGDDGIGAHLRAACAADAGGFVRTGGGVIALHVGAALQGQDVLGAGGDAEPAALAAVLAEGEVDCHGAKSPFLLICLFPGFFHFDLYGKQGQIPELVLKPGLRRVADDGNAGEPGRLLRQCGALPDVLRRGLAAEVGVVHQARAAQARHGLDAP